MRTCFTCGQRFERWTDLNVHLQKIHNKKKFIHNNETTVGFAMEHGAIVRFNKPSVKRETRT